MTDLPDLIVFDLGRVLVDVDFERFVQRVADDTASEQRARQIAQSANKLACDRGMLPPLELARRSIAAAELRVATPEFLGAWADIFTPFKAAARAVSALAKLRPLWLLSDTDPVHFARIERDVPWLSAFERVELSFERGMMKSDAGAFDFLRAECGRRRVAFVDDIEQHVLASEQVGCEGVWFQGWDGALPEWLSSAARD